MNVKLRLFLMQKPCQHRREQLFCHQQGGMHGAGKTDDRFSMRHRHQRGFPSRPNGNAVSDDLSRLGNSLCRIVALTASPIPGAAGEQDQVVSLCRRQNRPTDGVFLIRQHRQDLRRASALLHHQLEQ